MGIQGVFGYIIGKKKRLIHVQDDADLLWQILVREIYVLMNHYETKEKLCEAFEKVKVAKNNPTTDAIEKCKTFTDFRNEKTDWQNILSLCKISFINLLESGYILNQKTDYGYVFLLDFNKGEVNHYFKDFEGKIKQLDKANLNEIMEFNEMPKKKYIEIVTEMREGFESYYKKLMEIRIEIDKINKIIKEARHQGAINIEDKVKPILDNYIFEEKVLHNSRRPFYYRLKALDLIEDACD